jgi:hypothetical protein
MKNILSDLLGRKTEVNTAMQFDAWFKSLASVLHHISHLSPSMNFESFSRHATDALCHGLAPLQPIAAHFHIDVSTSHLWLPDSTFKLDSFFRMQNRILMSSQTRPVETSREELHKTICAIPYEIHKQAIEIVIYHKEDARPFQAIVAPVLEGFTRAITQALSLREGHLLKKLEWENQVEKILGSRLADAIHQIQSPFLFAQHMRAFRLSSTDDGNEHIFLNVNNVQEICRGILLRVNNKKKHETSGTSRTIAFVASLAAQLRLFENNNVQANFSEFSTHIANCVGSVGHLLTMQETLSVVLLELSQKTGNVKWHNAGFPAPVVFGKHNDTVTLPTASPLKPVVPGEPHDWQSHQSITLPTSTGLLFFGDAVLKRMSEIHLSQSALYDRLRTITNAAQLIIEAEKALSKPDSTRVVSASVTPWNELPYDVSLLAVCHAPAKSL